MNALQMMASGQFLYADVGTHPSSQGWAIADQMLRMMLGMEPLPADTPMPVRLFTRDNVGSLTLTPEAYRSGEWYGSVQYKDMFTELWNAG